MNKNIWLVLVEPIFGYLKIVFGNATKYFVEIEKILLHTFF